MLDLASPLDGFGSPFGARRFDPRTLFRNSEKGAILDLTDRSSLFTTSAGSTNVSTKGGLLGRAVDKSPNGNNFTQSTANLSALALDAGASFSSGGFGCLVGPSIDFSGTAKITLALSIRRMAELTGPTILFEFGANGYTTAGAFYLALNNAAANDRNYGVAFNPSGGTNGYGVTASTFQAPENDTLILELDATAATPAAMAALEVNGASASLTYGDNGSAGTAWGNLVPYLGARLTGSNWANADIYRVVLIGRTLTAAEKANLRSWLNVVPSISNKIAVVGDSTIAPYLDFLAIHHFLPTSVGTQLIATPGDTIAQQTTKWNALPSFAHIQGVVVQIGLNDLDPAETAATALGRLQTLITDINADTSAPIIISQMTPCKSRLAALFPGNPSGAYQKWLDMNDAIAGNGGNAITGVDARVTSHVALLNDGSGNLAAAYDYGDGIHENNAGRAIVAAAWLPALQGLGLA